MNLKPLSIGPKRAEQLSKLVALDDQRLLQAYKTLHNSSQSLLRLGDVLDLLRDQLGEAAEDVMKLLLSLRRFSDDKRASPTEVFDALVAGLKKIKWSEGKIAQLQAKRSILVDLLTLELIHNTYKLADLYFGHDKHLHSTAIYTELRPVFNSARSSTEGYILYSTLRIVYSDRFETEEMLMLSIKREELETLRDECQRALQKLNVLDSELRKKTGQTIIQYSGSFTEHD